MKGFLCKLHILMFSASLLGTPVMAEPVVRIAVPDITSLLTDDRDGVYQKIMRRALEGLNVSVTEQFFPFKRAMMVFEERRADCIYSFTEVLKQRLGEDAVIASFPLGKFTYYLFTLKGEPPIRALAQLEGKTVGAVIGHEVYLGEFLESQDVNVIWSKSDAQNLAMLEHHRFDAMIAAVPDVRPLMDGLSYDPKAPLLESYDRLTCHNTDANRQFLSKLSARLKALKAAGVYEQLAGNLYLEFKGRVSEPGSSVLN